jgi:hypothetical protein
MIHNGSYLGRMERVKVSVPVNMEIFGNGNGTGERL